MKELIGNMEQLDLKSSKQIDPDKIDRPRKNVAQTNGSSNQMEIGSSKQTESDKPISINQADHPNKMLTLTSLHIRTFQGLSITGIQMFHKSER